MSRNKQLKNLSKNITRKSSNKEYTDKKPFYDKDNIVMEIIPIFFFIVMIIIVIVLYPVMPEKIPIHWNAAGVADNFGSKNIALFLMPGIYLFLLLLLIIFPAIDVYKDNVKKFYKYYIYFKIMFGGFFLALFIATLLPNFGYNINILILSTLF